MSWVVRETEERARGGGGVQQERAEEKQSVYAVGVVWVKCVGGPVSTQPGGQ